MFDKFGEMSSYTEINELAANLLQEGDLDSLKELAKEGMAIIMVSSEWQEVFALSDRVLVMRHGRIVHEDNTATGNQDLMMEKAILGGI